MRLLGRRKFAKRKKQGETSIYLHVIYGVLVMLFVLLLAYGVWYITRLPYFTIQSVAVEGGETVSHDRIVNLVEQELNGSHLLLIPYRFLYFYPHDRIVEVLEKESRIHSVVVLREEKRLRVSFEEYVPSALWCLSDLDASPCYFIDATGYAFAEAPELNGGSFIRHVFEDEAELREQQLIDVSELVNIKSFAKVLEDELGFRVASVIHTTDGDINFRINGGGYLYTAPSMSVGVTYENLRSVLTSDEFSHITPGNFSYIDLRFGNKVYVNEELQIATTSNNGQKEEPHPETGAAQVDE